jgi:dienelactone hydrolase
MSALFRVPKIIPLTLNWVNLDGKGFRGVGCGKGFWILSPNGRLSPTPRALAIGKLKSLKDDAIMSDVGKSIDFLAGKTEINATAIGVIGFCMGGRYAFLTNSVYSNKIKAAVAFYGGGIDAVPGNPLGQKSLLNRVTTMQSPIMLMYGSEDQLISADEHGRVATALSHTLHPFCIIDRILQICYPD